MWSGWSPRSSAAAANGEGVGNVAVAERHEGLAPLGDRSDVARDEVPAGGPGDDERGALGGHDHPAAAGVEDDDGPRPLELRGRDLHGEHEVVVDDHGTLDEVADDL
jgi:hypothetical protein